MELLKNEKLYKKIQSLNVDFHDYISYMNDEECVCDWHGVSVQQEQVYGYELSRRNISIRERLLSVPNPPHSEVLIDNFLNLMQSFIRDCISMESSWIILRDNNRKKWLSDLEETSVVKRNIVNLFKKEDISFNYRGAFYLDSRSLIDVLPDLISFPYYNKSEDINLLNEENDCIIRFTHHYSVEFISVKIEEIAEFLFKVKQLNLFKIREYE